MLDVGDLAAGNQSAFTDDEWMTLASYEARFGVRRAVMYAFPTDAYGLTSTGGGFDVVDEADDRALHGRGRRVFVGANCAVPVAIDDGWAYGGQAIDAATVPLLVDDAGTVYAATRTYPDGREALAMTFAQSPTSLHSLELAYGVVNWVTRGLFVGEHHVYLAPQIDDFFLASALYPTTAGTYRITADDLQAFTELAGGAPGRSADGPVPRGVRVQRLRRARRRAATALTDKALALGPTFAWINHTWDHAEMDAMSYANAFDGAEPEQSVRHRVRPVALQRREPGDAQHDGTGQRRGDARRVRRRHPPGDQRCVGALRGQPVAERRLLQRAGSDAAPDPAPPTDLYFNVSQPAEWIAEYEVLHIDARRQLRRRSSTPRARRSCATCCAARTIRGCSTRRTSAISAAARA